MTGLGLALAVACLLCAGCTGGSSSGPSGSSAVRTSPPSAAPPPTPVPSTSAPSTTAATSGPVSTGSPTSGPPSASPSRSPSPNRGTLRLSLPRVGTGRFELRLAGPAIVVPGGGLSLVWRDGAGDAVAIGGPAFLGSRRTSPTLTVTIQVAANPATPATAALTATSSAGECAVRLTAVRRHDVTGSFRCAGLRTPRGTLRATASFTASP